MKKYFNISLAVFTLWLGGQQAIAQDGGQLFKAKCNTCHMVDKNSTGPNLKGVKQKWTDAGEAEMLYEWVANSEALIASGKSKMANEIKGFSPSAMTPQVVTNEELDAILNYIDTYTAPVETPPAEGANPTDPAANVTFVPDYNENLTLFYWLFGSIIVLLIAIIIMSTSITTLVKSDYFKKKLEERGKEKGESSTPITPILAIIGAFGAMVVGNNSHALTFMAAGDAEKGTPWLVVENMDLYFMVVINVILLGVLFYLRRMFRDFMAMARPKAAEATPETAIKKINVILTDAVAIEEEHTILMQHEYDGIRELDNNLPPWWVWGFVATIIFAVVYVFNYHIFGTADLQIKAYDKEIAQAKADVKKYQEEHAMNVDETTATLLTDAAAISSGKAIFESNCVVCHNPKGEGNIGPNLTDDHWIYGPDVKDLFKTIKLGTPNGMPEHASKLNPVQIQEVASFVLSLPNTPGKAPDGKLYPAKK
jgi:cytochrome c oxidase cbb3-type subunit 3